ncbi:MAG: ABC transporter ATP-binding protein [Candidatus Riflebacteria bacterium]|nr:ABC transporter ATP-binding protein [Candidatus Riflebacteria bacterium]
MIEIGRLERHYSHSCGVVKAVDGLDLTVAQGEFLAVMGPSGSGKSTLLYMLGAMDRPTGGWVRIDGQGLEAMSDAELSVFRNRRLGFVFQSFHLLPRLDLSRNVELPMRYAGVSSAARRSRSEALLTAVGLADHKTHLPVELSGGQSQRAAVARALANDPALLLADEPTGNLDSRTGHEVMGIFQALNRRGLTIVMVTHDLEMARHAKRLITMRDGRIVEDRTVESPNQAPSPVAFDLSALEKCP